MTPQKFAWQVTTKAIANGQLIRATVCACGARNRIEAHHDDYELPLLVRWLCRKCHRAAHRALGYVYQAAWSTGRKNFTEDKVRAALELANGSVTEAARLLGCSRQTVYEWMTREQIVIARVVQP